MSTCVHNLLTALMALGAIILFFTAYNALVDFMKIVDYRGFFNAIKNTTRYAVRPIVYASATALLVFSIFKFHTIETKQYIALTDCGTGKPVVAQTLSTNFICMR